MLVPLASLFMGWPKQVYDPIVPLLLVRVRGMALEAANTSASASGITAAIWGVLFAALLEKLGHRAALTGLVLLPLPFAYFALLYTDVNAVLMMVLNR